MSFSVLTHLRSPLSAISQEGETKSVDKEGSFSTSEDHLFAQDNTLSTPHLLAHLLKDHDTSHIRLDTLSPSGYKLLHEQLDAPFQLYPGIFITLGMFLSYLLKYQLPIRDIEVIGGAVPITKECLQIMADQLPSQSTLMQSLLTATISEYKTAWNDLDIRITLDLPSREQEELLPRIIFSILSELSYNRLSPEQIKNCCLGNYCLFKNNFLLLTLGDPAVRTLDLSFQFSDQKPCLFSKGALSASILAFLTKGELCQIRYQGVYLGEWFIDTMTKQIRLIQTNLAGNKGAFPRLLMYKTRGYLSFDRSVDTKLAHTFFELFPSKELAFFYLHTKSRKHFPDTATAQLSCSLNLSQTLLDTLPLKTAQSYLPLTLQKSYSLERSSPFTVALSNEILERPQNIPSILHLLSTTAVAQFFLKLIEPDSTTDYDSVVALSREGSRLQFSIDKRDRFSFVDLPLFPAITAPFALSTELLEQLLFPLFHAQQTDLPLLLEKREELLQALSEAQIDPKLLWNEVMQYAKSRDPVLSMEAVALAPILFCINPNLNKTDFFIHLLPSILSLSTEEPFQRFLLVHIRSLLSDSSSPAAETVITHLIEKLPADGYQEPLFSYCLIEELALSQEPLCLQQGKQLLEFSLMNGLFKPNQIRQLQRLIIIGFSKMDPLKAWQIYKRSFQRSDTDYFSFESISAFFFLSRHLLASPLINPETVQESFEKAVSILMKSVPYRNRCTTSDHAWSFRQNHFYCIRIADGEERVVKSKPVYNLQKSLNRSFITFSDYLLKKGLFKENFRLLQLLHERRFITEMTPRLPHHFFNLAAAILESAREAKNMELASESLLLGIYLKGYSQKDKALIRALFEQLCRDDLAEARTWLLQWQDASISSELRYLWGELSAQLHHLQCAQYLDSSQPAQATRLCIKQPKNITAEIFTKLFSTHLTKDELELALALLQAAPLPLEIQRREAWITLIRSHVTNRGELSALHFIFKNSSRLKKQILIQQRAPIIQELFFALLPKEFKLSITLLHLFPEDFLDAEQEGAPFPLALERVIVKFTQSEKSDWAWKLLQFSLNKQIELPNKQLWAEITERLLHHPLFTVSKGKELFITAKKHGLYAYCSEATLFSLRELFFKRIINDKAASAQDLVVAFKVLIKMRLYPQINKEKWIALYDIFTDKSLKKANLTIPAEREALLRRELDISSPQAASRWEILIINSLKSDNLLLTGRILLDARPLFPDELFKALLIKFALKISKKKQVSKTTCSDFFKLFQQSPERFATIPPEAWEAIIHHSTVHRCYEMSWELFTQACRMHEPDEAFTRTIHFLLVACKRLSPRRVNNLLKIARETKSWRAFDSKKGSNLFEKAIHTDASADLQRETVTLLTQRLLSISSLLHRDYEESGFALLAIYFIGEHLLKQFKDKTVSSEILNKHIDTCTKLAKALATHPLPLCRAAAIGKREETLKMIHDDLKEKLRVPKQKRASLTFQFFKGMFVTTILLSIAHVFIIKPYYLTKDRQ